MSSRHPVEPVDDARPVVRGYTMIPGRPGAGKTTCNVFYDMLRLTEWEFRLVRGSGNPSDDASDAGDDLCA
ncbi:hypothetical protein [Paraburkholderia pallida]|uniref:Uncharacterized protein n=1 Tax=Paraburkholderia pallida TaxID=2547399 RepID=A0A4P7DAL3_9BURK|nr:hypothetical protein [Paraburkholderia pallida]QBR04260.1 hypothetical protein E1956_44880 [Paraburkholderia pallida]